MDSVLWFWPARVKCCLGWASKPNGLSDSVHIVKATHDINPCPCGPVVLNTIHLILSLYELINTSDLKVFWPKVNCYVQYPSTTLFASLYTMHEGYSQLKHWSGNAYAKVICSTHKTRTGTQWNAETSQIPDEGIKVRLMMCIFIKNYT